ncbi:GFA family protein [Phaeobacter marinintestinus]|uniref:GFA family protein n=1 Tax=Falsiphaeobacter marinintestinus TaxID=1492905 RepID=UPI0011B37D02|nr:GFA family protein [Phaeobacter marinintestinus]
MTDISGQCLCGAVTVTATINTGERPAIVRACHCDMCRRQTSSMFMSLATDPGTLKIEGPEKIYRSSEWAQRGFCEVCGSTLWYGTLHDGVKNIAAGLFDNAAGAPLKLEFYSDMVPEGYALAGDHRRLTTQDAIALFAPQEGDNS